MKNLFGTKGFLAVMLLGMMLIGSACSGAAPQVVEVSREVFDEGELAAMADMEESESMEISFSRSEDSGASASSTVAQEEAEPAQNRMIIRNGNLRLLVTDTQETMTSINTLTDGYAGWVVESRTINHPDGTYGNMTLRVPSDSFISAMEEIKGFAFEVLDESASGQDVTDEFVDISARLQNLEATADRVRQFLLDAETIEEALEVNKELSRLEGEIESMKGRIKYLSQSAAYSTISVALEPDIDIQPIEVAGWRPSGVAKAATEALLGTLQGIGSMLIWLGIYFLPIGLIVMIPLYIGYRWVRRGQRPEPVSG